MSQSQLIDRITMVVLSQIVSHSVLLFLFILYMSYPGLQPCMHFCRRQDMFTADVLGHNLCIGYEL